MGQSRISYRKGYRYQLAAEYRLLVSISPKFPGNAQAEYLLLDREGMLTIRTGYAWDGASGPAVDTPTILRGSLVHDALYQLIRLGLVEPAYRRLADTIFLEICREDGMSTIRRFWVFRAVRWFGGRSATPAAERPILQTP